MESVEQGIQVAIRYFLQQPSPTGDELEAAHDAFMRAMLGQGIQADTAQELFKFVPLAFSRRLFQSLGIPIGYSDDYIVFYSDSKRESKPLGANECFRAAVQAAQSWVSQDEVRKIASFGSEYHAIQNAISAANAGNSEVTCIGVSSPGIHCDKPSPRPWWRLW